MSSKREYFKDYLYDIAITFAGEDREVVSRIAKALRASGLSVFFDEFEEDSLWGKNLYDHLADVYSKQARFCLMIISEHYVSKAWPSHERRSAQARALEEGELEYILPLRLDDARVPGLLSTLKYLDLRIVPVERVVELSVKKVKAAVVSGKQELVAQRQSDFSEISNLPHELRGLPHAVVDPVIRKDSAWQLEFFLAVLKFEIEKSKRLKQKLRYGVPSKKIHHLEPLEFFKWSSAYFQISVRRVKALGVMINEGFNDLFGSGFGDIEPLPILELARNIGGVYRQILESSLECNSLFVEHDFERLASLHSRAQEGIIDSIERVYSELTHLFDSWAALPQEQKGSIDGCVNISVEMPLADEISRESERVARSLGYL